jgi:hypothetical protein
MTRPDYVAMSDPTPNPQFRRHWEHPPPQRRKRPVAANQGRFRITGNSNDDGAQSIPSGPFVKPFDGTVVERRCYVYENIGGGYHLLLVDDDGALILVGQVDDWEAAVWIASLVNAELARLRRGRRP